MKQEYRKHAYPIDHFFSSLADQYGSRSTGVVLSGTGTDGAKGLQKIQENVGLTIVQDPISAEFDGMPHASLALINPDLVLSPRKIGEWICGALLTLTDLNSKQSKFLRGVLRYVEDRKEIPSKNASMIRSTSPLKKSGSFKGDK